MQDLEGKAPRREDGGAGLLLVRSVLQLLNFLNPCVLCEASIGHQKCSSHLHGPVPPI